MFILFETDARRFCEMNQIRNSPVGHSANYCSVWRMSRPFHIIGNWQQFLISHSLLGVIFVGLLQDIIFLIYLLYPCFPLDNSPLASLKNHLFICCFSSKHAALRRKSKDWLARNQNKVSEWSDMSIRGQLFQWGSTILSVLV